MRRGAVRESPRTREQIARQLNLDEVDRLALGDGGQRSIGGHVTRDLLGERDVKRCFGLLPHGARRVDELGVFKMAERPG